MKTLAVAVAATALLGAGATAQQAAHSPSAQTSATPSTTATSNPSTKLGTDATRKPVAAAPTKAAPPASTALAVDSQNQLVKQYCAGCHSERGKAGGLNLASFDAAKVEEHADITEKMIRKLRTGMMPPPNARRPEPALIASFVDTLENRIDAAAALNPNPGWRPFQRLNRAEYQRAVRDLVGIDVDVTAFLPPDTISRGFDNVADVQNFSPTLMESYLRAASQISRLAVGDRNASPTSVTYKIGRTASQMRQVEGAPMGTRGGTSVIHTFPADGDYVIKMSMHNEPLGGIYGRTSMATMDIKEQVEVSINGERAALVDLNTRMSETDPKNSLEVKTPPIHIAAGPHRVSAAFIQRFDGPLDDLLVPLENTLADVNISFGVTALPHMRDMTILGPSSVTGVSDTISRRMIFSCRPTTAKEEETCAADILKRLSAQVSSSFAVVGRQEKIIRRLMVSDTPVTEEGPRIVMSRMCGRAVTPKLMLTSASVFSSGTSRSSSGPSNRWMNAAEMRCGPAGMWVGGVLISRLFFGSVSLIRVLRSTSAARSPLIDTSTCSLMSIVAIEVRP